MRLYRPWGETHYTSGSLLTQDQYTGQWKSVSGLYWYNSRWYDSYITQFSQPDDIIPDPYNPLDLNRYSYARSNPIKYNDPSGHWVETVLDIAFIAYDVYQIQQEGWTLVNAAALAADAACAIVPLGTGGGPAIRALASGQDAATAVIAATKAVEQVPDAIRAGQGIEKYLQSIAGSGSSSASSLQDDLLDAANAPDRNGLTKAGRGLQKHSNRPGSAFPTTPQKRQLLNAAGSNIVKDILSNSKSVFNSYTSRNYGNLLEVIAPDGRGIRYQVIIVNGKTEYQFMGFLEP